MPHAVSRKIDQSSKKSKAQTGYNEKSTKTSIFLHNVIFPACEGLVAVAQVAAKGQGAQQETLPVQSLRVVGEEYLGASWTEGGGKAVCRKECLQG